MPGSELLDRTGEEIKPPEGSESNVGQPSLEELPPIIGKEGGEDPTSAADISAARQEGLAEEAARLEASGQPLVIKPGQARDLGREAVIKASREPGGNIGISGPQVREINPRPTVNPPLQMTSRGYRKL